MFAMKELKLSITHFKILKTISFLNSLQLYPTKEGVFKILHGDIDEDTKSLTNCPTFATLISYGSKKISRLILILTRYEYIRNVYYKNNDCFVLSLSKKGEDELNEYLKKHKSSFVKTNRKFIHQIFKIDEKI